MLILTRTPGEKILIGSDIEIMVTSVRGSQVRLGVTAPGLPILREEVPPRSGVPTTAPWNTDET